MVSKMQLLHLVFTFVFISTSSQIAQGQPQKGSRAKKVPRATSQYCRDLNRFRDVSILLIRMHCDEALKKTSFRETRHESPRSETHSAVLREPRSGMENYKKEHGLLNRLVHLLRKEYQSKRIKTESNDSTSGGRRRENNHSPLYLIRKWNKEHPTEG